MGFILGVLNANKLKEERP